MADCLVTGGSGYIGRALVERLERDGRFDRVINLDRRAADPDHRVDIDDPIDFDGDAYDFTTCFHLAALAKEPGFEPADYHRTNDAGTGHVLDLCDRLGISSVVFTSTMMVFAAGDSRHHEDDAPDPDTHYGASKAAAERRLQVWADADPARRLRIVRPAVVFGPDDEGNFERLRGMLARRLFFYVGRRTTVKSCIHLDDVVGHLHHLLDDDEGWTVVHSALPDAVTIEQIVDAMFTGFGGRYRVPTVPYRVAHAASRPFEWAARAGFDTGIHRRRVEKLYNSTDLAADRLAQSGYQLQYGTIDAAVRAWVAAELS